MSSVAASLHLASMVTRAMPHLLTERRVQVLLAAAFCDRVLIAKDFDAMKAAAKCLQNIPVTYTQTNDDSYATWNAVQKATSSLLAILSGRCCDDSLDCTRCAAYYTQLSHLLIHLCVFN